MSEKQVKEYILSLTTFSGSMLFGNTFASNAIASIPNLPCEPSNRWILTQTLFTFVLPAALTVLRWGVEHRKKRKIKKIEVQNNGNNTTGN